MDDRSFEISAKKILDNDREGLKEIYEAYAACIYTSILAVVKNRETAEDLTSDFFIKLWSAVRQYRFGGGHKAWMMTIARNMTLDYLRKNKRQMTDSELTPDIAAHDGDPEGAAISNLSFREALAQLDSDETSILTLKFMGGCTFKEIAAILQMPMGTVTWKYNKGIEKLRRSEYGR